MKKKLLFSVVLCLLVGAMTMYAQNPNPLESEYYIYGEQQITGRGSAQLNNIQSKGFSSPSISGGSVPGSRNSEEKMEYKFGAITTNPEINIDNKVLMYWRQLENGVWMSDAESGNGTSQTRLDKDACFVLVLDNSKSLGADVAKVQEGAIKFINEMYNASSAGNIRIGIIRFSSMEDTYVFPITPLTSDDKWKMINFIRGQEQGQKNATAMYYALNKGIEMLTSYVGSMNSRNLYEGSHIITFTDGLDNTSQIEEYQLYTAKDVAGFVKNKIHSAKLKGVSLDSWVVGVKGVDVLPAQLEMMKSQLSELATQNLYTSKSQFKFVENISELVAIFETIANNLTKQWKNLYCTSALNHNGPVCWTLDAPKVVAPKMEMPKPKKAKKQILLGLNVGLGMAYEYDYGFDYDYDGYYVEEGASCLKWTIGLDFAYPITSKFGFGAYASIGQVEGYGNYSVGALATIGDYNEKKVKFLVGAGGNICCGINADLRFGILFKKGLYLMTDIATGVDDPFAMTLNVGYNFGSLFK